MGGLGRTIPALAARDVATAVGFYRERFGFEPRHQEDGFAVIARDRAEIHLWEASDETWRGRPEPVRPGAESFLAGTASCRIEVEDVDVLYAELRDRDDLHPVSREGVTTTRLGTREFATLDQDGNLLTFFRWEAR